MVAQLFNRAPRAARTATPLLAFVAGEFADAIAGLWPAPHGDFFALPAARRHAAAILLAGHGRRPISESELRRLVEYQRDSVVADAIAGESSAGLMRVLTKAGEQLWRRRDYDVFMGVMTEPAANEVLRHLDAVHPDAFAPIAALPPALRMATIVRALPSEAAAVDLATAFRLAVLLREPNATARLARRWGSGGDTRAVFTRALEDLTPDEFRPGALPPMLDAPFVRIANRKQLEAVALEFRNCLAEHGGRVAEGRMVVYVWRGDQPAAIALSRDAAGWRLAEAKAIDNVDLDEALLRQIVGRLVAAGVRTGASLQTVASVIDDWARGATYPRVHHPGFIEGLALGDLWS
jgi:hypothetical protein